MSTRKRNTQSNKGSDVLATGKREIQIDAALRVLLVGYGQAFDVANCASIQSEQAGNNAAIQLVAVGVKADDLRGATAKGEPNPKLYNEVRDAILSGMTEKLKLAASEAAKDAAKTAKGSGNILTPSDELKAREKAKGKLTGRAMEKLRQQVEGIAAVFSVASAYAKSESVSLAVAIEKVKNDTAQAKKAASESLPLHVKIDNALGKAQEIAMKADTELGKAIAKILSQTRKDIAGAAKEVAEELGDAVM